MTGPLGITVWNEFVHERHREDVAAIYPQGIHNVIAEALREQLGDRVTVGTATLDQPDHGLDPELLKRTDVLFWWGHAAHDQVQIGLHSSDLLCSGRASLEP